MPGDTHHAVSEVDLLTRVHEALSGVCDPEIPTLSVVDLGMVADVECVGGAVRVKMTPTFVGCPALSIIRRNVESAVAAIDGVEQVEVEFVFDVPWTTERITGAGRDKLKEFGISPPACSLRAMHELRSHCPYCGSANTRLENLFGPTACRSVFYCNDCRQPFEAMKPV